MPNKTFKSELEAILTDVYIERPSVANAAAEAILELVEGLIGEDEPPDNTEILGKFLKTSWNNRTLNRNELRSEIKRKLHE